MALLRAAAPLLLLALFTSHPSQAAMLRSQPQGKPDTSLMAGDTAITGGKTEMFWKKHDCGRKVHVHHRAALLATQGTSPAPAPAEAVAVVIKDGFFSMDCYQDKLYYKGDMYGNNKDQYEMRGGVTITLYGETVPKEDQVSMTPAVCFDFCRSEPGMGYFGLIHGRECYCTPYPQMEAGDSSQCDAVCEGEPTSMCGGMKKSSIYEMHVCGSAVVASDLSTSLSAAKLLAGNLSSLADSAMGAASSLSNMSNGYQKIFGAVGDSAASDLMQAAKVSAGKLLHAAEASSALALSMNDTITQAEALDGSLTNDEIKQAGPLSAKMKGFAPEAEVETKSLTQLFELTSPPHTSAEGKNASDNYYPIMYFVDKQYEDMSTTCTGSMVAEPIYGKSANDCAATCDANLHSCVGFAYFTDACFMFSDFKSATYYTKCDTTPAADAKCFAKFQKFNGVTLKPDPSGKCPQCMKELTQADRCY